MERLWREMKIPKFYCMHVCKNFGDVGICSKIELFFHISITMAKY